jgi:ABC-type sulfate transport system substrate-binding protein
MIVVCEPIRTWWKTDLKASFLAKENDSLLVLINTSNALFQIVATKSTILLLKSVAVVKFTIRNPATHAVVTSTIIPEFQNVVITTL